MENNMENGRQWNAQPTDHYTNNINQWNAGYAYYGASTAVSVPHMKPPNAFKPDIRDFAFALTVFVLGYLFSSWVLFTWRGWGVSAFTTMYLLAVTMYLIKTCQ